MAGFGTEPSHVQQGSGEDSGEGLGAEPGQVQRGKFRRRFQEALVPEKLPEKIWEACCRARLVQSQVRFNNRVLDKVPEEAWGALMVQSHIKFNRVPEKVPGGFGAEPGQM